VAAATARLDEVEGSRDVKLAWAQRAQQRRVRQVVWHGRVGGGQRRQLGAQAGQRRVAPLGRLAQLALCDGAQLVRERHAVKVGASAAHVGNCTLLACM
jgi:hypothetical protein